MNELLALLYVVEESLDSRINIDNLFSDIGKKYPFL